MFAVKAQRPKPASKYTCHITGQTDGLSPSHLVSWVSVDNDPQRSSSNQQGLQGVCPNPLRGLG